MANITSFSPTNNSSITVNNSSYWVENANQSWSLTEPDSDTLRFELRAGDHWSSPDYTDPSTSQRDEIAASKTYAAGTQINLSYDFMVEPGATDTANGPGKWTVLGQMHEYNVSDSPPFAVELVNGDHMAINIGTNTLKYLYTDPNPIQRGHYYSMNVQVKFDANGNGFLEVWRDGVQIVDYHGSIGTGAATYWKEGVYRSSASETMAVDYRNLQITTGAAAAPTTPTQPTTPATPTTPTTPAVQPAVTQVSASPGTGIEHAGNTVTLTLGFNEAVTVTGTPTLKLNDGGTGTYVSGSGTSSLTFRTTVASTDTNTSALAITAVNLPTGASIKDGSGLAANLSGAVKTFSGLQIDPTSPSSPTSVTNITSFSPTNNSRITVNNSSYWVENANQSWSLAEPDSDTLRFELRAGDHWSSPDYSDPSTSQRDEIAASKTYAAGTQINLSYDFMVEPGATDTANGPGKWTVLGEMHEYNVSDSPPFAVELVNGDHMAINIGTNTLKYLYTDPNPIQRGHYYSMNVQVKFDANGNGFLEVWRDGVQIVDYHGSIGTGAATYWKEGVYRSSASETMAVDYRNLQITTGAAAAPTMPTVQPAVTQVSASPGTDPVAKLALTASAKDPVAGADAPQTITVTDPQPVATTTTTSPHTTTVTNHPSSTSTSTVATTAPKPITVADPAPATGTSTASLASQSFALLNQYLAGNTGRVDPGQIVAAVSNGTGFGQDSFLTRPQH